MSVNAQVFQLNAEAVGVDPESADYDADAGIAIEAGKVWADVDAFTVSNPFATNHKKVDTKCNDYNKVTIDGNEIVTSGGIQGQENPKDADGGNPALTLKPAVGGAVIQIDAKKKGWVYIVAKLSTNKQYMVFEEVDPIGYKIAMEVLGSKEEFVEPARQYVPTGVLNLEVKGAPNNFNIIPEGTQIQWVIREFTGDIEAASAGDGLGMFYFPVDEGLTYLAHATGSKISWSGIYFSETEAANVTLTTGEGATLAIVNGEGVTPPAEEHIYSVIGTILGNWDVDTDMELTPEGGYKVLIENVAAGSYEFKIRQDHDWTVNWGSDYKQDGPNYKIDVAKDGSSIVISFDPTTGEAAAVVIDGEDPAAGGEEITLTLTEGHTLLVSDIEAAGGTDDDIVRFYIKNNAADSREGWGIGGFANSDNWTPIVEWTGVAGTEWTYEYTVAQIKETAGDTAGQYHGIGITINIYNDCKVDKVTLVKGGSTGIQGTKDQTQKTAVRYNLAGQKVDSNYKGIIIENGKKMMVK